MLADIQYSLRLYHLRFFVYFVRQKLGVDITLLDEDPDPIPITHDALFDGFYAWVQATPWITNSYRDWGEDYLNWF